MREDDFVVIGRIKTPYGVRGWVHVTSYTQPVDNIMRYEPWFIAPPAPAANAWKQVDVRACRAHGDGFVALLDAVADRTAAEALVGREIAVRRQALPATDPGEYYWRDLEGLAVVTQTGVTLGHVARLMETGAHDVIVVASTDAGNVRERLLPFVDHVVLDVDFEQRRMTVDWDPDWDG